VMSSNVVVGLRFHVEALKNSYPGECWGKFGTIISECIVLIVLLEQLESLPLEMETP